MVVVVVIVVVLNDDNFSRKLSGKSWRLIILPKTHGKSYKCFIIKSNGIPGFWLKKD